MPNIPSLEELLKAGVHFGHKAEKWHPNAEPLVFATRGGVHIINLEQTRELLVSALEFVKELVAQSKTILFVGTKKHVRDIISQHAKTAAVPYVNERWLGGTITNFKSIHGLVKRLEEIETQEKESNYQQKYNKRERLTFTEEKERLLKMIGGIRDMSSLPDALFVVDVREQMTAIREARKKGIHVVALVDSNIDPSLIDHPIPANDDSIRSVDLMVSLVTEAVTEGHKLSEERKAKEETEQAKEQEEKEVDEKDTSDKVRL